MRQTREATHREPVWRERSDFVIGADLEGGDSEQLFVRQLGPRRFELCCIPFFTYGMSLGDVVETDDQYTVMRVVERRGHRTFRVWFGDSFAPRDEIAQELADLGALLEWSSTNLLAVDAADDETAQAVVDYLQKRQTSGDLIYEDGE